MEMEISEEELMKTVERVHKLETEGYPCSGFECYDRGNFHASCTQCPQYGQVKVKPKGLKEILEECPELAKKYTYQEMIEKGWRPT